MLLSNGQALWAHASTKLHWLVRQHPFGAATLADEDLSVDFGALTTPRDRVAVVATEPLTTGEAWTRDGAGRAAVFVDGAPLAAHPGRRRRGPVRVDAGPCRAARSDHAATAPVLPNAAAPTCRPTRPMPGSVPSSAPSAPTAPPARLHGRCPNWRRRAGRPPTAGRPPKLATHPASTTRVFKPQGCQGVAAAT